MNAHCGSSAQHRQSTQQLMHQMAGTRHLLSGPERAWVWASVGWQTRGKGRSFVAFRCLGLPLLLCTFSEIIWMRLVKDYFSRNS
jgi:hypothetical protein